MDEQTDQNIDRFYQRERKMLRSMLSKTKQAPLPPSLPPQGTRAHPSQAELSSKHMAEQAQLLRYMFEGSFLPRLTALACFLKAPGFQSLCLAQVLQLMSRLSLPGCNEHRASVHVASVEDGFNPNVRV